MRSLFLNFLSCFALICVSLIGASAHADETSYTPLKVGDTVPEFTLIDASGSLVSYASMSGEKGAILLFVRSLDWCGYCKGQVNAWNKQASAFTDLGYSVSVISYDTPAISAPFLKDQNITIPAYYDKDSEFVKAFGILNEGMEPGTRFYGIPNPHIYVINTEGTVTHLYAEEGYKTRPSIEQILGDLQ